MTWAFISRFLIVVGLSLLALLLAITLWPTWHGELFSSPASFNLQPSLVGSAKVLVLENDWGWEVLLPLPIVAELRLDSIESLEMGSITSLVLSLFLLLPLLGAFAAIAGLIKKSLPFAGAIFISSISLLVAGSLFAAASFWVLGPQPRNSESKAVLSVLEDLYSPSPAEEPILIPGQELVTPQSPYYGGELICNKKGCRIIEP